MSDNYWMTPEQQEDWKKANEDTDRRRAEVESPSQWSNDTHEEFADIVDRARAKSKSGERLTQEEKQALKEYLKNPDAWLQNTKADIANRREDATPNVRYDESTGSYYDRYGRECNSKGERY